MKYKLDQIQLDDVWEYSLYKKKYFFFGLFSEWQLVVYTNNFDQVKHYIKLQEK